MSAFDNIREGLEKAWDNVAEGWREITERAGHALTRFNPKHGSSDVAEAEVVRAGARWSLLAAEIRDVGDAIEVRLESPGMKEEDFTLEVQGDMLIVRGEKRAEREERQGHYYLMERAYGSFQRAIRLPAAVDDTKAKASYAKGVLRVTLPRLAGAPGRRIPVEGG